MEQREGRRRTRMAAAITVAFVLSLALAGCMESEAGNDGQARTLRPVKTTVLEDASANESWTIPGMVRSLKDADLSFRVGGPVVELLVDRGQRVKKGDPIARIDPRDFDVAVETEKANLSLAKARLKEAERQHRRYETLESQNAAARSTFDRILASYEVAMASVDAAAKRLESAENRRKDIVLVAPFDGYVHRKYIDAHETVAIGQAVVSLVDLDHMEVELAIAEGMLALIPEVDAYSCQFDALPGVTVEAEFKELSKNPNPSNRSYPLYLSLKGNLGHRIRPGMATEVTLTARSRKPGFLVPTAAVVNTGENQTFVWVINPESKRTEKVAVQLLAVEATGLRVEGDLKEGRRIVAAGARELFNGQKVRLLRDPSPTNVGGEQ